MVDRRNRMRTPKNLVLVLEVQSKWTRLQRSWAHLKWLCKLEVVSNDDDSSSSNVKLEMVLLVPLIMWRRRRRRRRNGRGVWRSFQPLSVPVFPLEIQIPKQLVWLEVGWFRAVRIQLVKATALLPEIGSVWRRVGYKRWSRRRRHRRRWSTGRHCRFWRMVEMGSGPGGSWGKIRMMDVSLYVEPVDSLGQRDVDIEVIVHVDRRRVVRTLVRRGRGRGRGAATAPRSLHAATSSALLVVMLVVCLMRLVVVRHLWGQNTDVHYRF